MDEQSHPSLKDAATLSGLPIHTYLHCNVNSAMEISNRLPVNQHWFLLSESMFGLDGSVMPLQAFREKLPHQLSFIIDDAHGFGILKKDYWNERHRSPRDSRLVIKTLSLAKTIGCHGGAIVAPLKVTNSIRNLDHTWAGHTPFPTHLASAAQKSIESFSTNPELSLRLNRNMAQMSEILSNMGLNVKCPLSSPVFSLALSSDEDQRIEWNNLVRQAGIYPSFIRYPGCADQYIFRLAISASHQKEDLQKLGRVLRVLKQDFNCKRFLLSG